MAQPGVVAAVLGGPHMKRITCGHGVVFWFNAVEQHRHSPVKASAVLSGACGCGRGDRFGRETDLRPGDIGLSGLIGLCGLSRR